MTAKRIFSGSALIVMSIAFLAPTVIYGAESEFVIDADGEYPESMDTNAFWANSLGRRNLTSGLWEGTDYRPGIAIISIHMPDNVTLYIKNYKGPGTYYLHGTGDPYEYAKANNAVFSNDEPKVPYMIVEKSSGGSQVEITDDREGLLSGTYQLKLYMDGNKAIRRKGRIHSSLQILEIKSEKRYERNLSRWHCARHDQVLPQKLQLLLPNIQRWHALFFFEKAKIQKRRRIEIRENNRNLHATSTVRHEKRVGA